MNPCKMEAWVIGMIVRLVLPSFGDRDVSFPSPAMRLATLTDRRTIIPSRMIP